VTIGVNRLGVPSGPLTVQYTTSDGTAMNGINYVASSGTLSFASNETFKTFSIPLEYDPAITGNLLFYVSLTNASPGVALVTPVTTTVTVDDVDSGVEFASATNSIIKATTNAIIPVVRLGTSIGQVQVNFSASGGTAIPGVEYFATNGTLTFLDG